jgi:hypothetical protein
MVTMCEHSMLRTIVEGSPAIGDRRLMERCRGGNTSCDTSVTVAIEPAPHTETQITGWREADATPGLDQRTRLQYHRAALRRRGFRFVFVATFQHTGVQYGALVRFAEVSHFQFWQMLASHRPGAGQWRARRSCPLVTWPRATAVMHEAPAERGE